MKNLIFVLLLITLAACHHADKNSKAITSGADSVAINYFTGDGNVDTVTAVKIIHDKDTMQQLSDLIAERLVDIKTNCGYDGTIHFFKNDMVVQDIKFRMNDENCMLFTFIEDGKFTATALSPEAKKLLMAIKK